MELSPQGLPIIDLAPVSNDNANSMLDFVAAQVASACEAAGCFYIKNHSIDYSLIDNTFNDFRLFFAQPLDYKMKYKLLDAKLERGYFSFETQNVNAYMGRLNLPNDPVERFAFGPPYQLQPPAAENIYPDLPPSLKMNTINYFMAFKKLSDKLMHIFSLAAKAPEDYFYQNCLNGPHGMKCNFYPANSTPKPNQLDRFAAHTDITPFTILATDNCPGSLKVKNAQGEWVFADPVTDALFVNLGDVMQRWTNDKWKATEHKVVWSDRDKIEDRLAIPFFVAMNPNAKMECLPSFVPKGEKPKYEPVSISEYVSEPMNKLSSGY